MSAELLRRAAVKLRAHAKNATPAPWDSTGTEVWGTGYTGDGRRFWVGSTLHDPSHDGTVGDVESAYIALMHPPVALALADWLDANAEWMREAYTLTKGDDTDPIDACDQAAVAVARAILREDS
jgi:hypothetical protein